MPVQCEEHISDVFSLHQLARAERPPKHVDLSVSDISTVGIREASLVFFIALPLSSLSRFPSVPHMLYFFSFFFYSLSFSASLSFSFPVPVRGE